MSTVPTRIGKIRVVQSLESGGAALVAALGQLFAAVVMGGRHEMLTEIRRLVPECVSPLKPGEDTAAAASTTAPAEPRRQPRAIREAAPVTDLLFDDEPFAQPAM